MPSTRRVKVLGVLILVFLLTLLFYSGSSSSSRSNDDAHSVSDLYARTKNALEKGAGHTGVQQKALTGEEEAVAAQMSERLKEAAQVAKSNANAKAPKPDPPSAVNGVGSAADGAREEKGPAGRRKGAAGGEAQEPMREETAEEHEVEVELNSILKKSPIIIFSKSYCPHSRRAKNIFKQYTISPEPFIVELDQHPLGAAMQDKLQQLTGRRTVPNVLINAISIGGGDDVAELDAKGALAAKVRELVGPSIDIRKPEGAEQIG